CGTEANDAGVGTVTWGTLANACSSNNAYATASLNKTDESEYLKVTNFGFTTILSTDRVDGISVSVEENGTTNGANAVLEDHVQLVLAGTVQTALTDQATGAQWSTTDATVTYGSATDTWGRTYIYGSDVRNSGFGVAISAIGKSTSGNKTVVA